MMKWINGDYRRPEAEFLEPHEFRKLFNLSEDMLAKLLDSGFLPAPTRISKKNVIYTHKHAAILNLFIELNAFPDLDDGTESDQKKNPPK